MSNTKPPSSISEDGLLCTTGYIYDCERDLIKIRVPPFTFSGKKERGRMVSDKYFEGSTLSELDDFVPQDLTLRLALSRVAGMFDLSGLVEPFKLCYKVLLRASHKEVEGVWDKAVSPGLRKKWVGIFFDQLQIAKMEFPRFGLPSDCSTRNPCLHAFSDASETAKFQCVYLSYKDSLGKNKFKLL